MATYYVATTGSDGSDGGLATPWRTISKAVHSMVAGDTTYVRGGTYTEGMADFWSSGTAAAYITLKNYVGESPIMDATGRTFGILPRSYCEINGLEIKNAINNGINIWTFSYCRIIDCHVHHNGYQGIGIAGTGSTHHYISGCECSFNGQAGVSSGAGGCGINLYVTGDYSVIDGCSCHDNGITDGQWAAGIEFQGSYITVNNCTIYNNKLYGINPCRTHDSVVAFCKVYDNVYSGIVLDGGTYNTVVHHCQVYGNVTWGGYGAGIWIASNAGANNALYNNTVYGNLGGVAEGETAGISIVGTASHGNILKNNITDHNNRRAVFIYDANSISGGEDYNDWDELNHSKTIYFAGVEYSTLAAYRTASGHGAHSISADPTFTDGAGDDFTLVAGSPCIDAGINVGFTFLGLAPDMGALEGTGTIIPPETESELFGRVPSQLEVPSGYTIVVNSDGTWGVAEIGGGGPASGVSSVGLALPAQFTVTNSPVTSSGTLTGAWAIQAVNLVFASNAAAAPTFRALVSDDFPSTLIVSYRLGVGTSPAEPLTIYGALSGANFPYNAAFIDSAALAAGIGGGIGFVATDGTGTRAYGAVRGAKVNATSGQYGGNLEFYSRPNGGNLTKYATLSSVGVLSLTGDLNVSGRDIRPNTTLDTFTEDVPDLDPGTYCAHYRISSSKDIVIHGFKAGSDGEVVTFTNVGAYNITFATQSGTCSTEVDRFLVAGGSVVVAPNQRINLQRDGTTGRWRA